MTIDRSIIIVSVLAVIFACTLIALVAQVPSSWLEGRLWSAAWTRAARSARRLGGGRETR